jgi:hypothetical protein
MRGASAKFVAVIALLMAAAAFAQGPTLIYGLAIPEQVGALSHGPPVDYESKSTGLGYALRFLSRPGWLVDVYIYDFGLKTIPEDIDSAVLKNQMAQAKGDIFELGRRGSYANVADLGDFRIADGNAHPFACSTFSYLRGEKKDIDAISYLCLTSWKDKFVKIRMTAARNELSATDVTSFVKAWITLLRA